MKATQMQAIFDRFNTQGSWAALYWPDGDYTRLGVQAHWEIARVGEDGACWITHRAVGYQQGWQFVHTLKIVRAASEDPPYELDLVDDRGRQLHVEAIEPHTEPDETALWQEWLAYREANAALFAQIDRQLRAEHRHIAETWPEE